jgi:RNA polymerase sigma-70 factor (ECF subfamily)
VRVRLHRARLFVRKELSQLAPKPANKAWTAPGVPTPDSPDGATGKADRSRRCKEIFANLSDYLDGALDNSLCKELEWHMGGCKPCEAFLSSLRNTIEQTHSLPSQRPDPRVFAQVRARLARQVQMVAAEDK